MPVDVLVAGGGSAGLAAAVAAARGGAQALLVERHGALGGMASAALVHSVCGLYKLPGAGDAPELANGGFAAEFAERLLRCGGASGPHRLGRVDVLLQRPAAFAFLADEFARETPGLTVQLHTEIIAAGRESAMLTCRGQTWEIAVRAAVDATGDAVLASLRGAACEMASPERLQRPAFIFALGGVPPEALGDDARLRLARRVTEAVREGRLPQGAMGVHFRASPQPGEAYVTIDLTGGPAFHPLDPDCLTRLETEGRAIADALTRLLQSENADFAHAYIAAWPSRAGVRESRRVIGQRRIETADIEAGTAFPDAVAHSAWPIELRETAGGPKWRFPVDNRSCGIPLAALRARDDDTLYMAGRCLSCSHEAQAALRVIGTCLATGEAAGKAAAGV